MEKQEENLDFFQGLYGSNHINFRAKDLTEANSLMVKFYGSETTVFSIPEQVFLKDRFHKVDF